MEQAVAIVTGGASGIGRGIAIRGNQFAISNGGADAFRDLHEGRAAAAKIVLRP